MQIVGTVLGILFLAVIMVPLAVLAFGPFVMDELVERKKRSGADDARSPMSERRPG